MINFASFRKIFKGNFWKSLKNLPILLPDEKDREGVLKDVYLQLKNKTYSPLQPDLYVAYNKGHGVARITPAFSMNDYIVYYYCVTRMEHKLAQNRVDNTYGGWSVSGLEYRKKENQEYTKKFEDLFDPSVSIPSWSFNPIAWSEAYRDFNAKLYLSLQSVGEGYVVEVDIANFYDSINLDMLRKKIVELFDSDYSEEISLLFFFLQYWNKSINYYNPQTVGIPQDVTADCSRILANFFLQEYDIYVRDLCKENNIIYFRYADDQMFITSDANIIEHILYKISRKLAAMGLSINQKKVHVRSIEDMMEYRSFYLFDILLEPDSKNNPDKVKEFIDGVIEVLESDRKEKVKSRGIPLLNRALSCNWNKLTYSDKAKLFSWYLDVGYLKGAKHYQMRSIYSKLESEVQKTDFIKCLNTLALDVIHNSYHYEVLTFFKSVGLDDGEILSRIDELKQQYAN